MTTPREVAVRRLRRLRLLALTGLGVATAGLSAAVAGVVPGRSASATSTVHAPDPFSEPLTALAPGAPTATDEAPVASSGPS